MKKPLAVFSVLVVVLTVVALGAGVDGKWNGSISGPQGDMELTFTFKADGETLTGSVMSPMGEVPISNGKISGNDFSFDVDAGGNVISHQCKLDGDTITMKAQGPWGDMELTLKRASE